MKHVLWTLSAVLLLVGIISFFTASSVEEQTPVPTERIAVFTPLPESTIRSPLHVSGEANPEWFLEGAIHITLTNWDGLIIAEGVAEQGGKTPQGFSSFETDLFFEKPEFNNRGTLIIQKANPTRDPAKAEAREMTVFFE